MAADHDVTAIERRWQQRWLDEGTYNVDADDPRPKRYVLCMYPYPSGQAHMGHVENYTFGDLITRYATMQGFAVLSPIGFDSFGLPAENAAIKGGEHPRSFTEARIVELQDSLIAIGASYDWRRVIRSHDPEFMRWNQWIFLRFLEAGLVYRKKAPVNWCPGCQTVLANEQVLADGTCERSGDLVERRDLEQWFMRITDYAQELLDEGENLDWPDRVKTMQRNWIGRSEGVEFDMEVDGADARIRFYTTRPDTIFGVTFVVLAPEHPQVDALTTDAQRAAVDELRERVKRLSELERQTGEGPLDKRGVATGSFVVNPANGERVPVYIADYVLMGYGTGAVMGVPSEDSRDWAFATLHGLPIIRTVQPPDGWTGDGAYEGHDGVAINSDWLDGLGYDAAKVRAIEWLEEKGVGERKVHFRLRDWSVARQRYWGCPIPIVYCPDHGAVPVPEDQLPILLPDDVEFRPTGESPLKSHAGFVTTTCPICGGPATRETDTLDTFVDSSWYFLRFCDPHNTTKPFDRDVVDAWMPVDQYIGGIEHALLHLLYARFYTKALADLGLAPAGLREPFARLFNQGTIRWQGSRMSKSKGNLVRPQDILEEFGADALRVAMIFAGPPEDDIDWETVTLQGASRFLQRVWRVATDPTALGSVEDRAASDTDAAMVRATNRLVKTVTVDYDRWSFHTSVAACMEHTNTVFQYVQAGAETTTLASAIDTLLLVLAPMAPHITAELYERRTGQHVHAMPWPTFDEGLLAEEAVKMVVQLNGKVREVVSVSPSIDEQAAAKVALELPAIVEALAGDEPKRIIVKPPKLVNVLV